MDLFGRGMKHCKQCKTELEGGEEECPQCGFNPKMKGLRISLGFLMVLIIAITLSMVSAIVWPAAGPVLVAIAAVSFPLAVFMLVVSFIATPYRLGTVFTWF